MLWSRIYCLYGLHLSTDMYCFDFFIKIFFPLENTEDSVHVSFCHHIKHHQEVTHFQLSIIPSEEVRLCTCVCIWVYINHSARIFKVGNHWKDSNPSCPTTVQTTFITSGHSFTIYHHESFSNYKVLSLGRAADILFLNWCIPHCSLS